MMPEQSAQAGLDVRAKAIMPIHWGAFTLAMHSWTDPVERITKKAQELGIPVITPLIGQEISLRRLSKGYDTQWWLNK
jgi:L-ascorbate metabolism protein UlaG (beta-lactamase superfamily)